MDKLLQKNLHKISELQKQFEANKITSTVMTATNILGLTFTTLAVVGSFTPVSIGMASAALVYSWLKDWKLSNGYRDDLEVRRNHLVNHQEKQEAKEKFNSFRQEGDPLLLPPEKLKQLSKARVYERDKHLKRTQTKPSQQHEENMLTFHGYNSTEVMAPSVTGGPKHRQTVK